MRALTAIEHGATHACAPRQQQSKHFNGVMIAGLLKPTTAHTDFYAGIIGLPEMVKQKVKKQRQHWIEHGKVMNVDNGKPMVTNTLLYKDLLKLKKNKAPPTASWPRCYRRYQRTAGTRWRRTFLASTLS